MFKSSKFLFGLALVAILVVVGFTPVQARVAPLVPYCSVSEVEFDPLLETPDFYPPVLKVKIETVGQEDDFMFLPDSFGVEVLDGSMNPSASASGLNHEFQLPEGAFGVSVTPQENYTMEYPDCSGIALRNGAIVEYVAVATYQAPSLLISDKEPEDSEESEKPESVSLAAPYCSVSEVEFDPLLETPDFYPPVLNISIEGDTDANGFGTSVLNNQNPFAFEPGITRQLTMEEGPFQVDIKAPENYTITHPTCSELTLRNGTIVNYVALSTYKEPIDPVESNEPNDNSGSRSSGSRVGGNGGGNGGMVLGAGAINWDLLTDEERSEILAELMKQLAQLLKMFEEYKTGLLA